ncbi:MAG: DUF2149 domain-containing protein [Thermoguttaceae bacterium]|nr:DUF2149 domain-containing protein [Thermoguttaceae bacterium]
MTRQRNLRKISLDSIDEPTESITSGVENLFDVAMVFAVALIVALAAFWQSPLLFENQDFTAVVNPGKPDMELVVKEGKELKRYQASTEQGSGEGELLGRAYRLPDGKVVYVPTEAERKKNAAAE